MALFMIKKCFKQSVLYNIFGKDNKVKLKKTVFNLSYSKCKYHTTLVYFNIPPRPIKAAVRAKKQKFLKKPIPIWINMTVTELAISAKESRENIIQLLSELDQKTFTNDSTLSNLSIIKEVVKKLERDWNDISKNVKKTSVTDIKDYQIQDILKRNPPDPSVLIKRRPIITIMGHVDHGKTTLLDSLRKTSVVDSEFGGITQHIGAFNVTLNNGEKITFLDTPGHAAFNSMRERGANVTDIIILVVAADDGVMEQTIDSIRMAEEANVPVIVAVNKIDKQNADIDRTLNMLAQHGIIVEDLGGDVQSVNISARNQTNLNELIETILAEAEILELKGDPVGLVEGVIIESTNNVGLGKIASLAIKRGTLKKGQILVSNQSWARVKSIMDHTGVRLSEAKLSDVVRVTGWQSLPLVGEKVYQVENEKKAHMVLKCIQTNIDKQQSLDQKKAADEKYVNHLIDYKERIKCEAEGYVSTESNTRLKNQDNDVIKLNVIIKGDVAGSVEAILDVLNTYHDKRCPLLVVTYGIGPVTITDVELANTFNAIIYCFNTTTPANLLEEIKEKNVEISQFNVIYKLVDDLKLRLSNKLPLETVQEEIGKGIVLKQFEINEKRKKVKVAGCRCTHGSFKRNSFFKILRENHVIYDDKISEMRHIKNTVESLSTNVEGGLKLSSENIELNSGDLIICYNNVKKVPSIDWDPGF